MFKKICNMILPEAENISVWATGGCELCGFPALQLKLGEKTVFFWLASSIELFYISTWNAPKIYIPYVHINFTTIPRSFVHPPSPVRQNQRLSLQWGMWSEIPRKVPKEENSFCSWPCLWRWTHLCSVKPEYKDTETRSLTQLPTLTYLKDSLMYWCGLEWKINSI